MATLRTENLRKTKGIAGPSTTRATASNSDHEGCPVTADFASLKCSIEQPKKAAGGSTSLQAPHAGLEKGGGPSKPPLIPVSHKKPYGINAPFRMLLHCKRNRGGKVDYTAGAVVVAVALHKRYPGKFDPARKAECTRRKRCYCTSADFGRPAGRCLGRG
jgi:hypothetical protein